MTGDGHEILVGLVDCKPVPTPGADIAHLIATFEGIVAARAALIARIVPPLQLDEADRPLLRELERRQTVWQDTLAAARRAIGEQHRGFDQLRAYARTV